MITCYIVDSEEHAGEHLSTFIRQTPELELLGTEANPLNAWQQFDRRLIAPDLTILEADMPQISGISLAQLIKEKTRVILTSAYPDHALEAFEVGAIDYLLKPITYSRFLKAIGKVKEGLLMAAVNAYYRENNDSFFVKTSSNGRLVRIKYTEFWYAEEKKNYVRIFRENDVVQTYLTIKDLEERLPKENFVRIHKSYLVSLQKVVALTGTAAELENGTKIRIGLKYRSNLLAAIGPGLVARKRIK